MKTASGVALVLTLLVAATLLIFGTGALYLTQTDLRVTDNVRAKMLAKYDAETALEASLSALQHELDVNGAVPTTFTPPTGFGRQYRNL